MNELPGSPSPPQSDYRLSVALIPFALKSCHVFGESDTLRSLEAASESREDLPYGLEYISSLIFLAITIDMAYDNSGHDHSIW